MPAREREGEGMRLRTRILLIVLVLILGAGAMGGAFIYGLNQGTLTAEPVVTADLLGQQLRPAQELVTVNYYYTNMARYENQLDFYGWKVPFTTKTFIVSYDGVIKAGVDLSKAAIDIDEAEKTVTVTLPESAIISHEIPEDSLEVFDESDNVLNRISITEYTSFTADQKNEMEQRAIDNGLLTGASEKARDAVGSLLKMMPGMEEYALRVK